jgi:two-component system, LuxR family, sensor kinase FixL
MKNLNFDAHFQDLFDNTHDLIHFASMDGRILKVNPAWAKALRIEAGQVAGKSIYEFISPDCRERYKEYRDRMIDRRTVTEIEFELINKSGNRISVEGQIGCVYQHGVPIYTRGVFKNVTFKKLAEVAVGKNQRRLNAFLNSAPSAVIIIDSGQIVLEWNPRAEEIFGFQATEVFGRPLADIIIPVQYREAHANGMARFLKTGEGPVLNKTIEVSALHKDGHEFPVNLSISSVKLEQDWLFIAFISDITEYKLLQKEVIKKEAALLQSKILNDKKDEFLSMASHELKTPLTSLKAYVQLMEKNSVAQPQLAGKFVGKASGYIKKLETLISDLLDVSKIKTGKLSFNIEKFSFKEFLKETIEGLQHTTQSHHLIIAESVGAVCKADRIRLEQVVQNLVSNAIKFSPEATDVIIGSRMRAGMLEVYIQDQGIGISQENIDNLFERFYRVEGAEVKFPGLGIGLYIAKEIIERHRGKLWVESEAGKGSTFYFTLPVTGESGS